MSHDFPGDFETEDQPEWNWTRHGDGWALMQGRVSRQHGLNKLTVEADGFDCGGEELRNLIARLLNEHAEKTRAEQATVERLASMLHEPLMLPPGCPSLGERLIGAIDMLHQEIRTLKESEHDLLLLQRAWASVVRAALTQAENAGAMRAERDRDTSAGPAYTSAPFVRWERQCWETERLADALTKEEREAAEP